MEFNKAQSPDDEHRGHERTFYRHPVEIPLHFRRHDRPGHQGVAENLAFGGIRFRAQESLAVGVTLTLDFPTLGDDKEVHARVIWCHGSDDQGWEVGAAFLEECDHFRTRMVEQLFQIELYRQEVANREGRHLEMEEAAREWVKLYAAAFPR